MVHHSMVCFRLNYVVAGFASLEMMQPCTRLSFHWRTLVGFLFFRRKIEVRLIEKQFRYLHKPVHGSVWNTSEVS